MQRCPEQDLNLRPTDRKPKCLTRYTTAPLKCSVPTVTLTGCAVEDERLRVVELDGESLLIHVQVVHHLDVREIVEFSLSGVGLTVFDQCTRRPFQLHVTGARNL